MSSPQRIVWLSVGASVATLVLKFAAWAMTGSTGLLSDAAESLVNLGAGSIAVLTLAVSSRPADEKHPFGHDKAEYFSSGAEGALILVAAGGILWAAAARVMDPQPLGDLGPGLIVAAVASVINLVVSRILIQAARQFDSIVLEADAKHLMTDVWTSVGIIGGLGVVAIWPKLAFLDPLLAMAMAANIVFGGLELLRRSLDGLMDRALPEAETAQVVECIRQVTAGRYSFHGLRTRKAGARRFVDFHLLVPGGMSVAESHDLTKLVEKALRQCLPRVQATIHVEPEEDGEAHDGQSVGGLADELPACGTCHPEGC